MQKVILSLIALSLLIIPGVAQDDALDPDLAEQLALIESNTIRIRQLDPLQDVPVFFPTRDELRAFLTSELDEQLNQVAIADDIAFYVAFDFMARDVDLRTVLLDFYEAQVAGFYDPDTDAMNVILTSGEAVGSFLPLLERITYSHEYVHALQDQHFDLNTVVDQALAEANADAYRAALALVEGDATLVMNTYLTAITEANPLVTLLQLGFGFANASGSLVIPDSVPDIIATELLWPYTAGERFVRTVYNTTQTWAPVNAAYANPPASTEQIIHPQRYLDGDMPMSVTLEDRSDALGEGWALIKTGVLGEFYLREWLRTQLENDAVNTAATGWGGDAYRIYQDGAHNLAWSLRLVWDTPADLEEFNAALAQFAEARYGRLVLERAAEGIFCWSQDDSGAGQALCRVWDEDGITLAVASSIDLAAALLG